MFLSSVRKRIVNAPGGKAVGLSHVSYADDVSSQIDLERMRCRCDGGVVAGSVAVVTGPWCPLHWAGPNFRSPAQVHFHVGPT